MNLNEIFEAQPKFYDISLNTFYANHTLARVV